MNTIHYWVYSTDNLAATTIDYSSIPLKNFINNWYKLDIPV
ncbi:unnamed protein product, partial [marine sediment metagenome]